jgi:hypothetical protein
MAAKKSKRKRATGATRPQPAATPGGQPPVSAPAVAASASCLLLVLYLAMHWAEIGRLFRWLAG